MTPTVLHRLVLTNVRSHGTLDIRPGPGLTILVGANGTGKTTVLEAAALLLGGRLLRRGVVRDLIRSGEHYLRIEADLGVAGARITAAAAYSREGERRLTADGAPLDDSSRWRSAMPVRAFVPDDLRLIKGGPGRRRDYLDGLAAAYVQGHPLELRRYTEALEQRNALLRSRAEPDEFEPWERILANTGLQISAARALALSRFVRTFQQTYATLSGEPGESVRLVHRTNVAGLDEQGYQGRLAENRDADRRRTFTHVGPHRDDFRLVRGGLDMRECASQGEQRTALLALVLAECTRDDGPPQALLLLDDVMSELDERRRRALLGMIAGRGQTIVTATDLGYFTSEDLAHATVVRLACTADGPSGGIERREER